PAGAYLRQQLFSSQYPSEEQINVRQRRSVHGVIKSGIGIAGEHHFEVAHEGGAGGGLAARVGGGASDDHRICPVIAQDRVQVSFEKGVELVDNAVLERAFAG